MAVEFTVLFCITVTIWVCYSPRTPSISAERSFVQVTGGKWHVPFPSSLTKSTVTDFKTLLNHWIFSGKLKLYYITNYLFGILENMMMGVKSDVTRVFPSQSKGIILKKPVGSKSSRKSLRPLLAIFCCRLFSFRVYPLRLSERVFPINVWRSQEASIYSRYVSVLFVRLYTLFFSLSKLHSNFPDSGDFWRTQGIFWFAGTIDFLSFCLHLVEN